MVSVAAGDTPLTCPGQAVQRHVVISPQEVQVRHVVVGLQCEQRHAVALAKLAHTLITAGGPAEIIQHDQAHGHVVQSDADAFGVLVRRQFFIRTLVTGQGFGETVLPVMDIRDIQLQARPAPVVSQREKDLTRLVGGRAGLLVLSQQNQCLD